MILKILKRDKRRALVSILSCLGVVLLMTLFEGTASAATLQEIKQRGYMIVATEDDYPPFEFVKDGVGMGLDMFTIETVADAKGKGSLVAKQVEKEKTIDHKNFEDSVHEAIRAVRDTLAGKVVSDGAPPPKLDHP